MYKKKYLKYKNKYLDLKIQSGGERDALADVKIAFLGHTIRSPAPLVKISYNNMISNLTGEEIIKYLEKNNYYMMETNKYGYLLNLSLFQINIKYLQNVKKTLNELNNKYQSYKSKTIKSIWLEELNFL